MLFLEMDKPEGMPGERAMMAADVAIIADSPFGRSAAGRAIVTLLRRLAAQNNLTYGDTEGDRGWWDGITITVNKEFHEKLCKTIPTLVHEASHAIWRTNHPLRDGQTESMQEAVDNELYAEENEIAVYKWLKDTKKLCTADPDLDLRLERKARGTLRSTIEGRERENRGSAIKK